MPRLELALEAIANLEELIRTHNLPRDTKSRVRASLMPLRQFGQVGRELHGRYEGLRFILGPWRWMLIIYRFDQEQDRIAVLRIQDARTSQAATTERG